MTLSLTQLPVGYEQVLACCFSRAGDYCNRYVIDKIKFIPPRIGFLILKNLGLILLFLFL